LINNNITFNCSATGNNLLNLSLIVNGNTYYSVENTTGGQTSLYLQYSKMFSSIGTNNWICKINTSNYTQDSILRAFHVNYTRENSQTYNANAPPLSEESFGINITITGTWTNTAAYLFYNHTIYLGTVSNVGGDVLAARTITTPYITASANVSFVWGFKLTNSTGDYWFNFTPYNQTIVPIQIGLCTAALNVSFINFTIRDENTFIKINSTFRITISGDGFDYSYNDTKNVNSSFAFVSIPLTAIIQ